VLLHLEVGNAVAQQAAGPGVLLEEMNLMAGARQLLRAGEAGRAGADDGDLLAGLCGGDLGLIQPSPSPLSTMAHSIVLMVTGVSSMLSVQEASQGAGQTRPVNSGKLLVECRLRERLLPLAVVDEVVPVRDLVVHRTAVVTIGNAAVHAARRLSRVPFVDSGMTNSL
jgi:hypothetical protein